MKIGIIIGSVRNGRIGDQIGQWVLEQAAHRSIGYSLIDLREFDLPIYASREMPAHAHHTYDDERVTAWSEAINACDGYIFITPEYNHGVPGALKNAFDSIFPEWWSKAVAFIGYGAAFGFRVVEQWRPIVANANMFDIKAQVGFSTIVHFQDGQFKPEDRHLTELTAQFDSLETAAAAMNTMRADR